jgi:hypothetical protein
MGPADSMALVIPLHRSYAQEGCTRARSQARCGSLELMRGVPLERNLGEADADLTGFSASLSLRVPATDNTDRPTCTRSRVGGPHTSSLRNGRLVSAPGVERIIDHELVLQVGRVIREQLTESLGDCLEARRQGVS